MCFPLQSLSTILLMSSWSFVRQLPLQHSFSSDGSNSLFLGDYTSFQLRFQSLVSISRAGKILVYNYQLRCPLQGLFGTLLSFQRSSNMVRVFLHQGYDLAALLFMGAMMQGFSTNILPHHFFLELSI